jgi:predicted transcriptional regulator
LKLSITEHEVMHPGTDRVEQTIRRRRAFLGALRAGPRRKRELVGALETSRSTVDRAVADLREAGLVTETAEGIAITLAGRMATEIDASYRRRIAALSEALEPLAAIDGQIGIDDAFLADARIEAASPHVPDLIIDRFYESVAAAPSVRTVVPMVLREHLLRFHEELTARSVDVELVIDTRVVDLLVADPEMATVIDAVRGAETMQVLTAELPMRFGVWETPTEAGVIVYTDTGPHSVLVSSHDSARRWAQTVYEEVAAEATPLARLLRRRGS